MAKRQVDKSKLEYASHPPEWILPLSDLELSGSERETIDFFLVTSPCKGVSARGVPLTSYGWDGDAPEKNGYLQNRLMKSANLRESENYFVGTKREDMKAVFNDAAMDNAFYEKHFDNRIAFLASGNTVLSLFRAVRNSFAHSRFNVIDIGSERFFIMENGVVSGDKFEVKARIMLKSSSLSEWVQIIKTEAVFAQEEKQRKLERDRIEHESLKAAALKAIKAGSVRRIQDFEEICGLTKSRAKKLISELKSEYQIEYSRSLRLWTAPETSLTDR